MTPWQQLIKLAKKKKKLSMKPLPHQSRVSESIKGSNSGTLVYHGLGSGKTFTAINASNETELPLVAIVPAALRSNFRKEIKNSKLQGKSTVMSYEQAMKKLDDKDFTDEIKGSILAVDEAHNLGQDTSTRSKLLDKLEPKKKLLLTGTPIRNRPSELVPLLKALKAEGAPLNVKDFNKKFIRDKAKDPKLSLWTKLMNAMSSKQQLAPKNLRKFKKMVDGKVDYHDATNPEFYPNTSVNVVPVEMSKKHLNIYSKAIGADKGIQYKVEHDIAPNKREVARMQSFLIGPRMASNTPESFSDEVDYKDSTKINKMIGDIQDMAKKDKHFKSLVYSNFLGAGVEGMAEGLKAKKIKYELFTGKMNDKQKKAAVDAYNKGKSKVLLVSGAGAEGIDLKGTKLVQIMEPHWNNARVSQAIGRAVRHKSHHHLPKKDRHVTINKYVSTVPKTWFERLFGLKNKQGVDRFMMNMANKKDELSKPFLDILRSVGDNQK